MNINGLFDDSNDTTQITAGVYESNGALAMPFEDAEAVWMGRSTGMCSPRAEPARSAPAQKPAVWLKGPLVKRPAAPGY
jgi:hypothetical protein